MPQLTSRRPPFTLAIVVNYHSARMCLDAVSSVMDADSLGPVHVVVADNSVDADEAYRLADGLPAGVSLVVYPENRGFAAACNQALSGYDPDMIFLLNPDATIDPGCLIRLQRCLMTDAEFAAAGPQIFWDPARRFLLPPSLPPEWMRLQHMLEPYPGLSRMSCLLWRRYALAVWRSVGPLRVWNLSGGHVLLKADAVRRVGGLFDERFFLYFEDSDLFWRLRKAGYRLMVEPRAVVVHGFDRCARSMIARKRQWMQESADRFWEKHGAEGRFFRRVRGLSMLRCLFQISDRLWDGLLSDEPVGGRQERMVRGPFSMNIPQKLRSGWLFEWSPNENFLPAAGCLGKGDRLDVSQDDFDLLSPGVYVARIGPDRGMVPQTRRFRIVKEG